MLFCTYLDLLPLNLVYLVLENGNYVLKNNISFNMGTLCITIIKYYIVLIAFSVFLLGCNQY